MPGLRQLVAWLIQCGVTTVDLEASGVYGHVLFLTLLEAGFVAIVTSSLVPKLRLGTHLRETLFRVSYLGHSLVPILQNYAVKPTR